MFNSAFKIVYFIELLIATIIRITYTSNYKKLNYDIQKKSKVDSIFLGINGIAMTLPIIYVFSSLLDFANYSLPNWCGWTGAVLFGFSIWLLWRSHYDLGRNWTPTLGLRYEHKLITYGVFKYVRHPMYAAHLLWSIAQVMLLHNWIAGYSFLIAQVPFYLIRIKKEEEMMIEQFGAEYKAYMTRTGSFIPKKLN